MGKHGRSVHIPHGIDAFKACTHSFVNLDHSPWIPFQIKALDPQSLGKGLPADADQQSLRLDLIPITGQDPDAVGTECGRILHGATKQDLDPHRAQFLQEEPCDSPILTRYQLVFHLHDEDLHSEPGKYAGKLNPHSAPAQHDHAFRDAVHFKGVIGCQYARIVIVQL